MMTTPPLTSDIDELFCDHQQQEDYSKQQQRHHHQQQQEEQLSRPLSNATPNPSAVFSTTCESVASEGHDLDGFGDSWEDSADTKPPSPPATFTRIQKTHSWKHRTMELFFVQLILYLSITLGVQTTNTLKIQPEKNSTILDQTLSLEENCIYVPGGGFSGFWFSLGRLRALEDPHKERFVCYSAGCLGVVATLIHHHQLNSPNIETNDATDHPHYERLYDMARSIQVSWQTGDTHRYRVVESFIDGLLEPLKTSLEANNGSTKELMDVLSNNVYIVTTVYGDEGHGDNEHSSSLSSLIPRATWQQPQDLVGLKQMLLQTTWIPLATGSSWTHWGHMDGAFSMAQHPRCHKTVGLEMRLPESSSSSSTTWKESVQKLAVLWTNTLNVNLGKSDVERLWDIGLEFGV